MPAELTFGQECLWLYAGTPFPSLCCSCCFGTFSLSLALGFFFLSVYLFLLFFGGSLGATPDSPSGQQEWAAPGVLEASAEASVGEGEVGESTHS